MSQCYIYNKSFFSNIDHSDELIINLDKLKDLIPGKNDSNDGVWQPIIIGPEQSDTKWTEILSSPNTDIDISFNPCDCIPATSENYESLVASNALHCDYCLVARGTGNIPFSGTIVNSKTNAIAPYKIIDLCSGVLDSRTQVDDILPKIPKLNQKYITKFNDFKYLNLFPANSNPGLGFEQFIEASTLKSFSTSPKLIIDWKIKETMGEIPYNPDTSQYDSMEDHTKAYNKFLQTGKTCGNFYLTKLNPKAQKFTNPDKQKLKDAIAQFKKDNPEHVMSNDQEVIDIIKTDGPSYIYLGMTPEEAEAFIDNIPSDPLLFENLIGDLEYNLLHKRNIPGRKQWLGGLQEIVYLEPEDEPYIGFKTIDNVRYSVSYGKNVEINPPSGIIQNTLRYAEFYWKIEDILFQNENNENIQPGDPEWEDIRTYYTKLAVIWNTQPSLDKFPIPLTDEILQASLDSGGFTRKILFPLILTNNYVTDKNQLLQMSPIKNNDIPFPTTADEADVKNTNLFEKIPEQKKKYYTPLFPKGFIGEWRAFDCSEEVKPLLLKTIEPEIKDFYINIAMDPMIEENSNIPTINISSISNIMIKCSLGMNLTYINDIPDPVFPETPINPYGFKNNTYDNIYIKDMKLGSHWKWNPTSGVLCWYRYTNLNIDPDMNNDDRVIPGVDLYISPGDIFNATNIGPEILNKNPIGPDNYDCPSGLKLVKNNEIAGIIPEESQFTYISNNIYSKVLELYESISLADILDNTFMRPIEKFNLACTLATGPQYDNIIVDLFKRGSYKNDYNSFKQLNLLNLNSTTETLFQNANGLNGYIRTKKDLINALAHKYGSYLWQEPNSSVSLTTKNNINAQSAVNLTFDAVIEQNTNQNGTAPCSTFTSCADTAGLKKKFSYDQLFSCGGAILNSNTNATGRSDQRCNSDGSAMETYKAAITSSLLFNGNKLKETVYSSGCYVFQDIYPRPYNHKTSAKNQTCGTDANPCGPESSYGIYSENSDSLCINGTTTNNITTYWCDYPRAHRINNSNNLNNGVTNRPSGTYYNDTRYFKRSYPFAAFMPHIDTVAFHKQRGIYFDSKDFGNDTVFVQDGDQYALTSSPMTIEFTTKDVGIKIYSVSIEKLREPSDTSTYNCRSFPSKDSCKCFPITFLPEYPYDCASKSSITYTNSPILYTPNLSCQYSIKSYGGYDRTYLDSIVTAGSTIPNHPNVGALLPTVDTKINPETPYGCEKSQTMTINNYTKSTWSFNLNKFSTVHADIWAEVIEAVNPFKTTNFVPGNDYEEDSSTPNPDYKRFATKVEINNVSLYSKQKKIIGTSTSIGMVLTNPFLKALLNGEDHIFYPKTIDYQGYCKTNGYYNGGWLNDGDQMSAVGIKFSSIPRKQILNFAIQKPDDTGKLKRGFFDPNLGIIYDDNKEKSPIIVYNSGEGYYLNYDKKLFGGSYNDGMVLIGDLNIKIKKILDTIGSFPNHKKIRLYLKVNNKWLEYGVDNTFGFIQDQVYIGEPYVFEDSLNDRTKLTNGPIVPVAAKQNLLFDIKYNPVGTGEINVLSSYPLMDNEKILGNSYNLVYSNIRPYFYVGEKITGNSDYLQTNFTNLLIDFNISNIGYVSGSLRPTEQSVIYYDTVDTSFRHPQTFKILSKKLNIISDSEGYGIQTVFEIDQKPKLESGTLIIDFSDTSNNTNYGIDSVVLYQNIESLKFEKDSRLANNDYKTKWGDIINYDGKPHHELSNYIFNQNYLNKYYPESLYDSFADTIAINNNTSGLYNYIIKNKQTNNNTTISYTGLSYVLQHQRFNVGQLEITTNFDDYKNYLPFIDLNFVPNPGETSLIRNEMPESLYNLNIPHGMYISGVYYNTPKSELVSYSDADKKFWINLRPENLMRSALTINKEFYSNTLRIDDTPFKLRAVKTSSSSNSSNCRAIFRPSVNISNVSFPDNFFNFSDYSNRVFKTDPFARFPIYCDTDNPGQCNGDPGPSCGIKTIGSIGVSGEYDILTESTGTIKSKIGSIDDIPYILSYDGGLYNIVGNNKLHYIKRFELNPINNLYPLGGCSSESSPRPTNGKFSILSEEYQKILSDNSSASHTDIVKNTDLLANEMLFRTLYGSKQKINLTSLNSSKDDLISYEDLIKYSDPKIEAKDIYKNIPYDLDVNSKSKNRQIIGNISIDGVLKVGKSVSISIGASSIGISIQRNNGKIEAVATLPNGKIKKNILETEYTIIKELSISTGLIPNQSNDGSTITRSVGQCPTMSIAVSNISLRGDTTFETTCSANCNEDVDPIFFEPYPRREVRPGSPPPTQGYVTLYDINEGECGTARGSSVGGNWECEEVDAVVQVLGPDGFGKTPPEYKTVATSTCNFFRQNMIRSAGAVGVGQNYDTSRCGTCFTTDADYWYGNYHNKFHYYLGSSNAQAACECEPYEYGYCRKNSACDTCPYEYAEFTYKFEYCRHSFDLIAYKRKLNSKLQNPVLKSDPLSGYQCPPHLTGPSSCDCSNDGASCPGAKPPVTQTTVSYTEYCGGIVDVSTIQWYVYEITIRENKTRYNPVCAANLCNISYTNNKLTFIMGSVNECVDISLRDNCPPISVNVPDNTFIIRDTIDSSCIDCDIEPNSIKMNDQNPPWEIITETRTCVLGHFLDGGNPNPEPYAVFGAIGAVTLCEGFADPVRPILNGGVCGQMGGGSVWKTTYIGNSLTSWCSGPNVPVFEGAGIFGVSWPLSHGAAHSAYRAAWKELMRQTFEDIKPCRTSTLNAYINNEPDPNPELYSKPESRTDTITKYTINDIVEGVVPGTCSFNFATVSYPAINVFNTPNGAQQQGTSVTVLVAYYTYQYRRPKNPQDILIGEETTIKCNTLSALCGGTPILSSKYKTTDCSDSPSCYNKTAKDCNNTDYCCIFTQDG